MNPLEQQLKRLCEVAPDEFLSYDEQSKELYWKLNGDVALWIDADGQLQGGEALWFMIASMQDRWHDLDDANPTEAQVICKFCQEMIGYASPELILSTYIQWKEAQA